MCLDLKSTSKKHLAKTDLICYKIVYDKGLGCLKTYYMLTDIKLGKTYKSDLIRDSVNTDIYGNAREKGKGKKFTYIEVGLHSFKTYGEALEFYNERNYIQNIALVKTVIPKGSWYYEGKFAGTESYASTELRYDEILLTNRS